MAEAKIGRPRSESTRKAILEAICDLTTEVGFGQVTIDSIAARAGAGRQTLYRWWSSKSQILADAVVEGYLCLPMQPVPDTGRLDADLKVWLAATSTAMHDPSVRQLFRALAAAASDDENEAERLFAHITGPQYRLLISRIRAGQEAGQLCATVNPAAVVEAFLGSVLFRLLAGLPSLDNLDDVVAALLPQPVAKTTNAAARTAAQSLRDDTASA